LPDDEIHADVEMLWTVTSGAGELIDLRCEDEIVTGETRGGLRPGRESGASPFELDAGMMAFCLGQQRDPRDQSESADEVVKRELAGQVTGRVALPTRDSVTEAAHFRLRERWRSRWVFLAVVIDKLIDKLGDGRTVLVKRDLAADEKQRFVWKAVTWPVPPGTSARYGCVGRSTD
jgi:hypothetical protein